jgi:tRNA (guanine-N7-)-methyltransferase
MIDVPHPRAVKSFARREGRMTQGQARVLETIGQRVVVPTVAGIPLDLTNIFGRPAPTHLDIGFGAGESVAQSAALNPEQNYLGVEVHRPGVGQLLLKLEQTWLDNVRVVVGDAVELLSTQLPAQSLASVRIFCPDPWPKRKHLKRRLIQDEFMQSIRAALTLGGDVFLATDWAPYATHMLTVMGRADGFANVHADYAPRFPERPLTRFEKRGAKLGHAVFDLHFRRVA